MADFDFGMLQSSGQPMPLVPVRFPQLPHSRFVGLVDSGAGATRLPAELAEPLGVDLAGAQTESFVVADQKYTCLMAEVEMRIGSMKEKTIRVGFTAGWNSPHFLLGIRGFFENYVVTINAAKRRTSVKPSK